jgi:hypothetical protein
MKSGVSGQPHWVKLFGSTLLTTACATTLARESAINVETAKVGLANAPTKHVLLPEDDGYCQVCAARAKAQA